MKWIVQFILIKDDTNILVAGLSRLPSRDTFGNGLIRMAKEIYFAYSEFEKPILILGPNSSPSKAINWSMDFNNDEIFDKKEEAIDRFNQLVEKNKKTFFDLLFS